MEELLFNTPAAIGLRLSARLAAVLDSRRIAFCREWDHIIFPKDVIVEAYATFVRQAEFFELGAFSYAETSHYLGRVSVGRYTSIASEVEIFGERHPSEWVTQSMITYDFGYRGIQMAHEDFGAGLPAPVGFPNRHGGRVIIGHDVWIGRHVQLARGIIIGHGAMVGAGSVVTRDVPPYTVVAGVPAKPIRPRFENRIGERLLASAWWDYSPKCLWAFDYTDPAAFCSRFEEAADRGSLEPLTPLRTGSSDLLADLAQRHSKTEEPK